MNAVASTALIVLGVLQFLTVRNSDAMEPAGFLAALAVALGFITYPY